jgi:hypothetical protein
MSGHSEIEHQDVRKSQSNNNEYSNTEYNDTEYTKSFFSDISQSIDRSHRPRADGGDADKNDGMDKTDETDKNKKYRELIKKNIEYDALISDNPSKRGAIDELVEIIGEAVTTKKSHIKIGGEPMPVGEIKERFLALGQGHIQYVFECLEQNAAKIKNIKAYLLTALYNAPTTISNYYDARVRHDFNSS